MLPWSAEGHSRRTQLYWCVGDGYIVAKLTFGRKSLGHFRTPAHFIVNYILTTLLWLWSKWAVLLYSHQVIQKTTKKQDLAKNQMHLKAELSDYTNSIKTSSTKQNTGLAFYFGYGHCNIKKNNIIFYLSFLIASNWNDFTASWDTELH